MSDTKQMPPPESYWRPNELDWTVAIKAQPTAEAVRNADNAGIMSEFNACMYRAECRQQLVEIEQLRVKAEAVREACAQECGWVESGLTNAGRKLVASDCAAAIRALDLSKLGGRDE